MWQVLERGVQLQDSKIFAKAASSPRRAPNLIMPGIGKCGTSTLHDILVQHPEITGGVEKELRFLVDAEYDPGQPENIHSLGLNGWMTRYPDGGRGAFRYWLDASPQYQAQAIAREVIAELPDPPRLIFIVRKPSRRLFSVYQYFRHHIGAIPHITSFAQFLDEARSPENSPIACRHLMDNVMADTRYDEVLERWSGVVPSGHVWLTSLEALSMDRESVLTELAQWLGIDAAPLIGPAPVRSNPTIRVRNHNLMAAGGWLASRLPNAFPIRKAKDWGRNLLIGKVLPTEMAENAALLAELDREFAPRVERFNTMASAMQSGFRPLPV